MEKLVSVIIPVYNGELFLERCVKSVMKQTYKRLEIIVLNDGSTDKTELIVKKMQWVGYTFVEDEMFANLAGIKVFLAAGGNINESRAILLVKEIKDYLKDIEQNATEEDWLRCMNKTSYISVRKNENVNHFRNRWLAYYKDRILRFDKEVEKIKKNKSVNKFKTGQAKILSKANKEISINTTYERD